MANFIYLSEADYGQLRTKVDGIYEYIEYLRQSDNRLITTEQLLEFIPIGKSTLQHYRNRGLIRFIQRGRKILYSLSEVMEDLKNMNKM